MLMRLILLLIQLAVAWFGAQFLIPVIAPYLGDLGKAAIFVYAVLFAMIIFIVGLIASAVLRDVRSPTSGTLTFSLILAIVGASITMIPQAMQFISQTGVNISHLALPLIGAALGYFVKR